MEQVSLREVLVSPPPFLTKEDKGKANKSLAYLRNLIGSSSNFIRVSKQPFLSVFDGRALDELEPKEINRLLFIALENSKTEVVGAIQEQKEILDEATKHAVFKIDPKKELNSKKES